MKKLNLAIIGQGRSGRNIHGAFLKTENNVYFNVAAVVELDPERRARALEEYPGCDVYEDYHELFARDDLDLVVNATMSESHYPVTRELLLHGFNVLVEKPFARNYYECADLMRIAKEKGVLLAVFQQSFLAPYYKFTKDLVDNEKIGRVLSIDVSFSNFNRRWDWQTFQYKMAGCVYNTGPHPIGLALGFLGFSPDTQVVYSKLDRALASGDAEDWAKILLTAPGKPPVEVRICATDAFSDYTVKVQATRGTYQCTTLDYKMKYIVDGENPERPPVHEPLKNDEGLPIYCREQLITHEEEGKFDGDAFLEGTGGFYKSLYATLTEGVPLAVPTEWAAEIIRIIEIVHGQNPMPVKF